MNVQLTDPQRQHLRQMQRQRRNNDGYLQVTGLRLLDKGRPVSSIAQDLGLDQATVYRYAAAFAALGLEKYLLQEQPGYWGLLTRAQLAHLCREVNQTLYTTVQGRQAWLEQTYQVSYSCSGLPKLLHQLGFTYQLTTPLPCEANAAAQTAFLDQLAGVEAEGEAGHAVLYYADAAHPTHNTRCTRAWCAVGKERPLLTVSGREWVESERGPERLLPDAGAGG